MQVSVGSDEFGSNVGSKTTTSSTTKTTSGTSNNTTTSTASKTASTSSTASKTTTSTSSGTTTKATASTSSSSLNKDKIESFNLKDPYADDSTINSTPQSQNKDYIVVTAEEMAKATENSGNNGYIKVTAEEMAKANGTDISPKIDDKTSLNTDKIESFNLKDPYVNDSTINSTGTDISQKNDNDNGTVKDTQEPFISPNNLALQEEIAASIDFDYEAVSAELSGLYAKRDAIYKAISEVNSFTESSYTFYYIDENLKTYWTGLDDVNEYDSILSTVGAYADKIIYEKSKVLAAADVYLKNLDSEIAALQAQINNNIY